MNTNTTANFNFSAATDVAADGFTHVELDIRPLTLDEIILIGGGECLVNGL